MNSSYRFALRAGTCALASVLALFFTFLELLKASRSSQWSGIVTVDAVGIVAGIGVYAFLLFLVAYAVSAVLAKLVGRRFSAYTLVAVGGLAAGGVLWGMLSFFREYRPTPDDGVVLAGLFSVCFVLLARCALGLTSFFACCALLGTILLGGLAALIAVGDYFLFAQQRSGAVTILPVVWMLAAAVAGQSTWVDGARRRAFRRGLHVAVVLGFPLALLFMLNVTPSRVPGEARPNLVFIVSDTLRADYMGVYGGAAPTPNLARLAEGGTLFERSYSLAPWTMPSMTGMFSSTYPPGLTPEVDRGLWVNQLWQYEAVHAEEGIATKMRQAGYVTGALTSNAFLPVIPGLLVGFDVRVSAHPILLMRAGTLQHFPFLQDALGAVFPGLAPLRPHNTTLDMTRYTEAFLRRHRDEPFYLWVHYIDPHAPYDPPAMYRTGEGPWPFFYPYSGGEQWGVPILGQNFEITPVDRPYVQSLYEGEIQYVDEYVGRVVAMLTELGLDENTYVVFTSDHGEELWDHGQWGHGQSLHEELVRVPLIFSGPNIMPQRISYPVSAIDLTPTLADLVGVSPAAAWRGASLEPRLRGQLFDAAYQPIFAQATSNKAWPHPQQMVVLGSYKLVRGSGAEADGVVLYDLEGDPRETKDIAEAEPARTAAMKGLILAWLDSFESSFAADDSGVDDGVKDTVLEGLRGMGYL